MVTPQDIADVMNRVGFDTPDKLYAFVAPAKLQLDRSAVQAQIDNAIADQAAKANDTATRVAVLTEQRDAIDAEIRRLAG